MNAIANTTVISNFASIGQIELLRRIFGVLYISTEVYEEIQAGLEEGYTFYTCLDAHLHPQVETGWIRLTSIADERELLLFSRLPSRLHQGESSCLAIASCRNWLMLTDDRAARQEATRLGIRVSGSVGCLVVAIERGLCTVEQANVWLSKMIQIGYRSPVSDLHSLL